MDLKELAQEIKVIKENHLAHIAEDIDKIDKRVEKMDNRLWAIIILLIGGVLIGFIK